MTRERQYREDCTKLSSTDSSRRRVRFEVTKFEKRAEVRVRHVYERARKMAPGGAERCSHQSRQNHVYMATFQE